MSMHSYTLKHNHPDKREGELLKAMCDNGFRAGSGVPDLNGKTMFLPISGGNVPGDPHVHRQDAVRTTHGLHSGGRK